jgi:DDE superfamily endonuclease
MMPEDNPYSDAEDSISSGEDDEDGIQLGLRIIITIEEMMMLGLSIFFDESRIQRTAKDETNAQRFTSLFGSSAKVCTIIWEDIQTTIIPEARVDDNKLSPRYFLMAMNHLKRYPTESEREGPWDISAKIGREWVWYYLQKIQALKTQKISWPDDNFGTDIWAISVDGTHCWIEEPIHHEWSQDSEYYSHKYNKAGINYEIGISLAESRVVWLNGPFKAGVNDIKVFTRHGLKQKLEETNKKAIGDKGYVGHPDVVSTYNVHDCRGVNKFKSRALKRHETFNNLTKCFDCLSGRFRHSPDQFKTCFESVCVICQYQIENGSELFDILVEDIATDDVEEDL